VGLHPQIAGHAGLPLSLRIYRPAFRACSLLGLFPAGATFPSFPVCLPTEGFFQTRTFVLPLLRLAAFQEVNGGGRTPYSTSLLLLFRPASVKNGGNVGEAGIDQGKKRKQRKADYQQVLSTLFDDFVWGLSGA